MRIIAFDPSLLNLGVSVGRVVDGKLIIEYVDTFYVGKLAEAYSTLPDWDVDPNTRRVEMLRLITTRMLTSYNVDMMVIELPIFNGKNPKSLQVQMKAIVTLQVAAIQFNDRMRSNIVEYMPNVIKQGVGIDVRKSGGDKTAITKALLRLQTEGSLVYEDKQYTPDEVDEHANDSVAMLYTKFKELDDVYVSEIRSGG